MTASEHCLSTGRAALSRAIQAFAVRHKI
ncbi:hypothetical protein NITLEN_10261 [Nitrospira lenta]|uniref:Uncharacterized protein n=1 Tax=Nitrospira lenta TaxID=1436998 RepID=A0A330L086_9BACT|nr:hypothetical protein NITLEN_10261 [Nitrospira lenta]